MDEEKFRNFSKWVLVIGVAAAAYMLLNTILHTTFGSTIRNPSEMVGPNAKY